MADQVIKEGWMAERGPRTLRYHYIRDQLALCYGFGFYRGALTPHVEEQPRGKEDCAKCHKILIAQNARKAVARIQENATPITDEEITKEIAASRADRHKRDS